MALTSFSTRDLARLMAVALSLSALIGCTPTFNWREVRAADGQLRVLFPCKPSSETRVSAVEGMKLRITLQACTAGGATFALSVADVGDASLADGALTAWARAQAGNLGAAPQPLTKLLVAGLPPSATAWRQQWSGRMPDGKAVMQQVASFASGPQVFQATVLGPPEDPQAVETFFASLDMAAPTPAVTHVEAPARPKHP